MALWVPFAFIRGMKIIREHNIGTVYVSSPPHSTQIIGCLLKKFTGVRLIADFRDPIIGNAYGTSFKDNKSLRLRIERNLDDRLEYLIVACADKIVVNTETHRREMMERHEKDIFVTVRNSFDKSDYDGIDGRRYDTFTVAHVGSMYGLRRPDVILRAIKHLDQTRGSEQLRLQVLFVGLNEPHLVEMIKRYGLERYVKILPMVSHHEAIEIMVHSHLLLLIKATGPGSLGKIPGKFFEYVGTGNRIIVLGPLESEVAGIIKEINAGVVFEDDVKQLADFMSREYDAFLAGETKRVMPKDIDKFSSEYMASKLIELL